MALPLLFSLLGSGLAGAGAVGISPLLAGSLGAGLGSAIQTGDLEEGLKTGLTAGLLGGIGGALTGGAGAGAADAATAAATQGAGAAGAGAGAGAGAAGAGAGAAGAGTAGASGMTAGQQVAQQAANQAGALSSVQGAAGAAPAPGGGLMGMFKNMPSGMSPVAAPEAGAMAGGIGNLAQRGLQQGVMSGAGLGTAMGSMYGAQPQMDMEEDEYVNPNRKEPKPARRERLDPGQNYRPGIDPEASYFSPSIYSAGQIGQLAGGGQVQYNIPQIGPVRLAAGGLADIAGEPVPDPMGPQAGQPMAQPNEKEIIQLAVSAVQGQMPEEQAAIVLAQFVQTYGEDALRALVKDVESGRASGPRGDVEGPVKGAGDGMSDMVPARMDDGSQDVLLSNDEFIVPADVVSGLGNGSSEAGADELYEMMDRVRQERTGKKEQPRPVAAGGMLPA